MTDRPKKGKVPHTKTSKPRKAYDVLAPPNIGEGDPTADPIYTAVGKALSTWEGVEVVLSNIFAIVTGGSGKLDGWPAKRAYGSITNLHGRREMLLKAAEVTLDQNSELFHKLKLFVDECKEFSARRNEIAHGSVQQLAIVDLI